MTLAEALKKYGEVVVLNSSGDPNQLGCTYPLTTTTTTMVWEGRSEVNTKDFFGVGNLVVIICKVPYGLCENNLYTPHVQGNVGMIKKICDYTTSDGEPCFIVKDTKGNEFSYAKSELIPAFPRDIANALRNVIERS